MAIGNQCEMILEQNTARFSECRRYRYELWRRWSNAPYCMFIGLNPSTADETQNDLTVRRCIDFAKQWKFGGLCMTNIFAFRATQPKVMKAEPDPIGSDNDRTLKALAEKAGIVIAAWGKDGRHMGRDKAVTAFLPSLHCLKQNIDGTPAHPLYLRRSLIPYLLH